MKNKKRQWQNLCDEYATLLATKLNEYQTAQCLGAGQEELRALEELAKEARAFVNDVQYLNLTKKGRQKK